MRSRTRSVAAVVSRGNSIGCAPMRPRAKALASSIHASSASSVVFLSKVTSTGSRRCWSASTSTARQTWWSFNSSSVSASAMLARIRLPSTAALRSRMSAINTNVLSMPMAVTAGRSLIAAGAAIKVHTDQHAQAAQRLHDRDLPPLEELEEKKIEAQRALATAKRQEAAGRPPEWYVILMGFTGAFVGYLTAVALKFVGRYVFYFAAAETTALLALTATGAITRGTALEVAKFTMPPFVWALRTALDLVRGEFGRALSSSSLALRFFFVLSFGLTMRYARTGPQQLFRR